MTTTHCPSCHANYYEHHYCLGQRQTTGPCECELNNLAVDVKENPDNLTSNPILKVEATEKT